jgi:hypothetical protein
MSAAPATLGRPATSATGNGCATQQTAAGADPRRHARATLTFFSGSDGVVVRRGVGGAARAWR